MHDSNDIDTIERITKLKSTLFILISFYVKFAAIIVNEFVLDQVVGSNFFGFLLKEVFHSSLCMVLSI